MAENVIVTNHLTKDYGSKKGIFDVSLSVRKGEVFGYLGPNGAGKTTTIRHLMGFIRQNSGDACILGMDCFADRDRIQKSLGYLPGEIALFDQMSGRAYLKFIADMKGMKDRSRMEELIAFFELNPDGKIRKMSKGMKQKIGIIAAFMHRPDILILDEPTSGLDPLMQNRFIELILQEKKRGATILLSSHIFEEIEKTCDRTAFIRDGRIIAIEEMEGMAKKKKKQYDVTFESEQKAQGFAASLSGTDAKADGNHVIVSAIGKPGQILSQIAGADPMDVDIRTQSLEELFLHFYGAEEKAQKSKEEGK